MVKGENRSSTYLGVYSSKKHGKKKWVARISIDGKRHELGLYADEREAAKAYDLRIIRDRLDRQTNFFKKKFGNKKNN